MGKIAVEFYEFRVFEKNLSHIEEKISNLCRFKKYKDREDLYIISDNDERNNIKIRKNELKIKTLIKRKEGLELWAQNFFFSFPLRDDILKKAVFPGLGVKVPDLKRKNYTIKEFLEELINPLPGLSTVKVLKKRASYELEDCDAEIADILIGGNSFQTAAVEGYHIKSVLKLKKMVGLEGFENTNYIKGIKNMLKAG